MPLEQLTSLPAINTTSWLLLSPGSPLKNLGNPLSVLVSCVPARQSPLLRPTFSWCGLVEHIPLNGKARVIHNSNELSVSARGGKYVHFMSSPEQFQP